MTLETVVTLLGVLGLFVLNAAWSHISDSKKGSSEKLEGKLDELTKSVIALTLALQKAELEAKHLSEKVVVIPELMKDVNLLGAKVRKMEAGHVEKP